MLLQCENISVFYKNKPALSNVSFKLDESDYFLILGENGTGKSTLIKTILGINKNYTGNFHFGENISKNDIGYISQNFSNAKNFPASVFEVVISGTLNKKKLSFYYNKSDIEIAKENIRYLNIENLSKKNFNDLSGGQQQRVLLARALTSSSKMLILDEPFNALDPIVSSDFYSILSKINREKNLCIIIISHQIKHILKYATKVLQLNKKVLFNGSKQDYLKSDLYREFISCEAVHGYE